jgi:hypothetical protein
LDWVIGCCTPFWLVVALVEFERLDDPDVPEVPDVPVAVAGVVDCALAKPITPATESAATEVTKSLDTFIKNSCK